MVIDLTHYEKKSLKIFLLTYIGSSTLLMLLIAGLVYQLQKNAILQNIEYEMRVESARIAGEITHAHMSNHDITAVNLKSKFGISLFDIDKQRLYGKLILPNNQAKSFFQDGETLYLIDDGSYGHLGINYILLSFNDLQDLFYNLQIKTVGFFFVVFIFIVIMSFILGKIFLKPIKNGIDIMDKFVKDSTHELNTPIAALLMSVNSMKKYGASDKKLSRIYSASKRIEVLYQDLTYKFFQEISSHEKNKIQLDQLIKERIDFLIEISNDKEITYNCNLQPTIIFAEIESITRLIDNLLINAIKYNFKNGTIDISLDSHSLKVMNSGDLIPPDIITLVTERYYRGDRKQVGFGIGLDIIKNVCDMYNFILKIEIVNNKNQFTIKL